MNQRPAKDVHHLVFSFFCVPSYISMFTSLGEIFAYVAGFVLCCFCFVVVVFFYPFIDVITFRLRGWCMLDVFLLPAFTRLGHEWQDRFSPCDWMHVCTDQTWVYTLIRKNLGGGGRRGGEESEPMVTPREKSPLPEAQNAGQRAQHTTDWAIRPPNPVLKVVFINI